MSQNWTPPPPPSAAPVNIPNYLVFAILTTVFCCLPAGVVSIVYAAQVNSKVAMGDIAGAMAAVAPCVACINCFTAIRSQLSNLIL